MYHPSIIKCKKKKRKVVDKMNILAEYYPEKKVIVIANSDAFFTSDAHAAIKMLEEANITSEVLFADAGFDDEELFEKCLNQKIKPMIKQREYKNPKKYRKKSFRDV